MKKSVIISFEGLDCSFKETNYKSFVTKLREQRDESCGYHIHVESFPRYKNPICTPVISWLQGELDRPRLKKMPIAVNSLYAIDRMHYWFGEQDTFEVRNADFLEGKEEPDKFHYFVFDRYALSNAVYNPIDNGYKRTLEFDHKYFGIYNPDIVVWMRMSNFDKIAEVLAAKQNRDKNELDLEFLRDAWERSERLIANNGWYIEKYTGATVIVVDVLDKNGEYKSREEIFDFIWREVNAAVARKCD